MEKEMTKEDHRRMKEEVREEMAKIREEDKRVYETGEKEGLIKKARNLLYWLYTE